MKLYGISVKKRNRIISLSDVTIESDPETLRKIADFINKCANEIEEYGNGWEHEHFIDFDEKNEYDCDIIIFNQKKDER